MINYKDSSVPGKEKDSTSPFSNKQDGLTMTNIIDESGRKKLVEILDNYKTDTMLAHDLDIDSDQARKSYHRKLHHLFSYFHPIGIWKTYRVPIEN